MRTMTWDEIDKDWAGLQKRHRGEIAAAVARYCVGHGIREVANRLGYSQKWVQTQLDTAAVHVAISGTPSIEGTSALVPLTGGENAAKHTQRVLSAFAPTEEEQKSEAFEPYVEHYQEQGYSDDIAKRMAKAEWAGEAAIEAGVIKETTNKQNQKVNQILFPEDGQDTFELNLRHHMAKIEAAARFLNDAKINYLRRKSTCEKVASAHAKWLEQVERIRNFHPTTFDKVI